MHLNTGSEFIQIPLFKQGFFSGHTPKEANLEKFQIQKIFFFNF